MFKFEFTLDRAGWAEARIITDSGTWSNAVSYAIDSPRELAEAVLSLLNRAKSAKVAFINEPGEHQLRLERRKGEQLRAVVTWHDDVFSKSTGEIVLEAETNMAQIHREVLRMLAALLRDMEANEYKRRWGHPFPHDAFEKLKEGYHGHLP